MSEKRVCLYELLGTTQDADDDVIKKAYRKQALVWHPDKNPHRLQEAQEKFQDIQYAYEVLSDKNERAWYDQHRESYMSRGVPDASGQFKDGVIIPQEEQDVLDFAEGGMWFRGYGDDAKGFYTVFAKIFSKIAEQEAAAWKLKKDPKAPAPLPPFGDSSAPEDTVRLFYSRWSMFQTGKDFSYADEYQGNTSMDRRTRRQIDEHNKKCVSSARKRWISCVTEILSFAKRRDRRWQAIQEEDAAARAALEQKRQEEEAARRQKEKEELAKRAAEYEEADWIQNSHGVVDGMESEDEETAKEAGGKKAAKFHCTVCNCSFKSDKQLENHTKSQKHVKAVKAQEAAMKAAGKASTSASIAATAAAAAAPAVEVVVEEKKAVKEEVKKAVEEEREEEEMEEKKGKKDKKSKKGEEEEEEVEEEEGKKDKKKDKKDKKSKKGEEEEEEVEEEEGKKDKKKDKDKKNKKGEEEEEVEDEGEGKKDKKKDKKDKKSKKGEEEEEEEGKKDKKEKKSKKEDEGDKEEANDDDDDDDKEKKKKKKEKKEKKKSKKDVEEEEEEAQDDDEDAMLFRLMALSKTKKKVVQYDDSDDE